MKIQSKSIIAQFVFCSLLLICSDIRAVDRIELPDGVYYNRFASTVSGPEAVWINPAAIGYFNTITVQWSAEAFSGHFARNWGLTTTGEGIGLSLRQFDDSRGEEYKEYIFGASKQLGYGFFIGGSYRYFKDGSSDYIRKHFWDIGFLLKQNPRLSLAAVLANLNRSKIKGQRSDIEQRYSASYAVYENILEISTEASFSTGQSLSDANYTYGIDFRPTHDLLTHANLDSDNNYEFGFRWDLKKYYVGFQTRFGDGDVHRGTSIIFGFIPELGKARGQGRGNR